MFLHDRIASVTGASRGIGAATAQVLAQRGARVALCGRTVSDLEAVAAPIRERPTFLSGIALRRLAQPAEVATVIAFLASDDASYVNGECIDINGGSYMV